jgi:hypothetical protein
MTRGEERSEVRNVAPLERCDRLAHPLVLALNVIDPTRVPGLQLPSPVGVFRCLERVPLA